MGTHNGTVLEPYLKHKGDNAWSDLTSWTAYSIWTQYTDTTIESTTGFKGTPLRYQTSIIDLGSSKYVYPKIMIGVFGTGRITIEYGDAADLSDATTIGTYTTNNSATGTIATYSMLNHTQAGYCDAGTTTISSTTYTLDYTGFKARYVRVTAFVESIINIRIQGSNIAYNGRGNPVIKSLLIEFHDDMQTEILYDVDTSGLTGSAEARVLVPRSLSTITSLQLTAHSEANKKLVPQIVSKANKTIRVLDANTFNTAAVDATVDVAMTGLPEVEELGNGSIDKIKKGDD